MMRKLHTEEARRLFPRRRVSGVVRNAAKKARDLRSKVCGVTLPLVT